MNKNITYCTKCGTTLLEEDKFCASCGSEVRQLPSAHKHPDPAEVVKPEPPTVNAPAIPIWKAAGEVNIEAVKQHLAAGTDVNARNAIGWTPLHEAVQCSCLTATLSVGHLEIIELLISKGADVNAKNEPYLQPPLNIAASGASANWNKPERTKIVELLIDAGADVNAKGDGLKPLGTPLDMAKRHPETADLLRKHGGKTSGELKAEGK